MTFVRYIILMNIVFVCFSCQKNDDKEEASFDRSEMLTSIANHVVSPTLTSFEQAVFTLDSLVKQVNGGDTVTIIDAIKTQWEVSINIWKKWEIYNIGDIKTTYITNKIDKWPINESFISDFITNNDSITEPFIDGKGSTSKGLHALEYLLYQPGTSDDVKVACQDSVYFQYIAGVAANLVTLAGTLQTEWSNYKGTFISETGNTSSGTINLLLNEQVSILEEILNAKLGKPLGNDNGGTSVPTQVESYYAQTSFSHIEANLKGLEASFTGENELGINSLLNFLNGNSEFTASVLTQFETCYTALSVISSPLSEAVDTQTIEVQTLFNEIKSLLVMFKVDMANQLGVTITFNDNDGD